MVRVNPNSTDASKLWSAPTANDYLRPTSIRSFITWSFDIHSMNLANDDLQERVEMTLARFDDAVKEMANSTKTIVRHKHQPWNVGDNTVADVGKESQGGNRGCDEKFRALTYRSNVLIVKLLRYDIWRVWMFFYFALDYRTGLYQQIWLFPSCSCQVSVFVSKTAHL